MPIPNTELSPDVRALADLLAAVPFGEVVPYAAMSECIGRDIRPVNYLAMSALRVVNREHGAIFATVRRVGYKRLLPTDAHMVGHTARAMVRRRASNAARKINNALARANDMPDAEKLRANAEVSALGLIQHMARDNVLPVPPSADKPMPTAMAARQFLERIGAKPDAA